MVRGSSIVVNPAATHDLHSLCDERLWAEHREHTINVQ